MPPEDEVRIHHLTDVASTAMGFIEGRIDIDLDVLWSTITIDLPAILAAMPTTPH